MRYGCVRTDNGVERIRIQATVAGRCLVQFVNRPRLPRRVRVDEGVHYQIGPLFAWAWVPEASTWEIEGYA